MVRSCACAARVCACDKVLPTRAAASQILVKPNCESYQEANNYHEYEVDPYLDDRWRFFGLQNEESQSGSNPKSKTLHRVPSVAELRTRQQPSPDQIAPSRHARARAAMAADVTDRLCYLEELADQT